eukprot:2887896-Rhodomonas_salina.1
MDSMLPRIMMCAGCVQVVRLFRKLKSLQKIISALTAALIPVANAFLVSVGGVRSRVGNMCSGFGCVSSLCVSSSRSLCRRMQQTFLVSTPCVIRVSSTFHPDLRILSPGMRLLQTR